MPIRIGVVGVGKIARDQHIPTITSDPTFDLVATADPVQAYSGIANFACIQDMLRKSDIEAVALCQPPQRRFADARYAIEAGRHVLLEKPPGATVSEVEVLAALARKHRVSLFVSWHSRFAPAVEPARKWLADKSIRTARISWVEDVRVWHPGQLWIWERSGFGVFDPGINALSIATHILPNFFVDAAKLWAPANVQAPIAALLHLRLANGGAGSVKFDWRVEGPPRWDIRIHTERGNLVLSRGGADLVIDGEPLAVSATPEYAKLYAYFATLIQSRKSDVDLAPMRHVADAFMRAKTVKTAPFDPST